MIDQPKMATCLGNSTCSSRSSRILLLCLLAANGLLVLAAGEITENKIVSSVRPPPPLLFPSYGEKLSTYLSAMAHSYIYIPARLVIKRGALSA